MSLEFLAYPFMVRALLAGALVALMLGWLGVFVTVRHMSFIGDGLAHASLAGIALAVLLGWAPLPTAVLSSVLVAIAIFFLEKKAKLTSDMAIAIMFSSGLALGVILLSFYKGYQPELISYLFGNILTVNAVDLRSIALSAFVVLATALLFHKRLLFSTIDPEGAHFAGLSPWKYELLLYVLMAAVVVLSIKLVGIVLVSALLVLPSAIARQFTRSFRSFTAWAIIFSLVIVIAGLVISYYLDLPSGATIVLFGASVFFSTSIIASLLAGRMTRM